MPRNAIRYVLGQWLRSPDPAAFESTWPIADELLRANVLQVWMGEQIRAESSTASPTFRQLARRHLAAQVDRDFEWFLQDGAPVWQLLFALGPDTSAEWYCALGDYAILRGDTPSAYQRYTLAEQYGSSQARERLTRWPDLMSYRALIRNEPGPEMAGSSSYLRLLQTAVGVARGLPATAEVSGSEDTRLWRQTIFVNALRRLRADDHSGASAELRRILGKRTRSADDLAVDASARILLGALESDDRMIAAGARKLFSHYGDRWPAYSIVDPYVVLIAVAHIEPALLGGNNSGSTVTNVRLVAAHRSLVRAAALLSDDQQVRARLSEAKRLLEGISGDSADKLRTSIDRITEVSAQRSRQHPSRTPGSLAFGALQQNGVCHPWSPAAELIWRSEDSLGPGDWRSLHHLAITLHARAYQLESDNDKRAFDYWTYALACWARLHADNEFWAGLRAHLTQVLAKDAVGDIDGVIAAARAALPAQVLEPHATRIHQLRGTQLQRARTHYEIILHAPLPTAARRQTLDSLIGAAAVQVGRLSREKNWDSALTEAQRWMQIDPTSLRFAELLLETSNDFLESLSTDSDWIARAHPVLNNVEYQTRPALRCLDGTGLLLTEMHTDDRRACMAALAKHEYWLGLLRQQVAGRYLGDLADGTPQWINECADEFLAAASHFSRALLLGLPPVSPYDQASKLQRAVETAGQKVREMDARTA
ncbi:hypothetical protein [Nocardia sp. NPDC020380]|uniref:hypothetical protein n=1 Tax=Nocardia sp. NPDC020380 TaxID=3364309 RepID=UPI0037B60C41